MNSDTLREFVEFDTWKTYCLLYAIGLNPREEGEVWWPYEWTFGP